MTRNSFIRTGAVFLSVIVIAPSAFFVAPPRVQAFLGFGDIVIDPTNLVQNTITAISNPIGDLASLAQQVNAYVLQPLAFVLSGNLMKALTASVVGFVTGKANGTGIPQFVVDVRQSMQTVSDGQALAYLRQVQLTNSPFAGSVSSALRNNYLQRSSLKGFWDANLCTIARSSPNVQSYLAGDWSQGGVAAWFSITTQVQNNPYTFYNNAQTQLISTIGSGVDGATGARQQELSWGKGFRSWCGTSAEATQASEFAAGAAQTTAAAAPRSVECTSSNSSFVDSMGSCYNSAADAAAADQINSAASTLANTGAGMTAKGGIGINPGDPCTNSDGTSGTIQTPGSVISDTLNKVLGGQQDQIVRMGNIGPQINKILGDIGTIVSTVNFATSLLGGSNGGLLTAGQTSSSNTTSRLSQFQNTTGVLGITSEQVQADGGAITATGPGTSAYARYTGAWSAISDAVNHASASVNALASYCTKSADDAKNNYLIPASFVTYAREQAATATSTLARVVTPLIAEIRIAASTTAPTIAEVAAAIQEAQALSSAIADPEGSLNVVAARGTKMTIVDQMGLLDTNAQALKPSCTPPITVIGG